MAVSTIPSLYESGNFTPTNSSAYDHYGGCHYEKYGKVCHLHIGLKGLTANSYTAVGQLPNILKPKRTVIAIGIGDGTQTLSYGQIDSSGVVHVASTSQYAAIDFTYIT